MRKKKQPAKRSPGQPRKYAAGSTLRVLLQIPLPMANQLDKRAEALGIKRTAAIQQAIAGWLGREVS